jgi:hypothetical protein
MKNLKKLNRKNLRSILGGHDCPSFYPIHIVWGSGHACCSVSPAGGNPCPYLSQCLVPKGMCDDGGPF